jgi:hypothetical protein
VRVGRLAMRRRLGLRVLVHWALLLRRRWLALLRAELAEAWHGVLLLLRALRGWREFARRLAVMRAKLPGSYSGARKLAATACCDCHRACSQRAEACSQYFVNISF